MSITGTTASSQTQRHGLMKEMEGIKARHAAVSVQL